MADASTARPGIEGVVTRILVDSGRPAPAPRDEDQLMADIGLDSLDLAVMVSSLEQVLGIDPFRDGRGAVRTFGELVAVYESALRERT